MEPGNATVQEIYPLLQERLTLGRSSGPSQLGLTTCTLTSDQELPTESSSEGSSEPDSQSDTSEDDHTPSTEGTTSTHCQH